MDLGTVREPGYGGSWLRSGPGYYMYVNLKVVDLGRRSEYIGQGRQTGGGGSQPPLNFGWGG